MGNCKIKFYRTYIFNTCKASTYSKEVHTQTECHAEHNLVILKIFSFIRVLAKLCRTLAVQEQNWLPVS